MRKGMTMLVLLLPALSGGCLAKAAFNVAAAPMKLASKTADWATTSQDEADRNYGRKMRRAEAEQGQARREPAKRCRRDPRQCADDAAYRGGDR